MKFPRWIRYVDWGLASLALIIVIGLAGIGGAIVMTYINVIAGYILMWFSAVATVTMALIGLTVLVRRIVIDAKVKAERSGRRAER